jgi:Arc/MetJ family transcription regulator
VKTRIDLDEELFDRARSILGTSGKSETVNAALREVVVRQAGQEWLDWWASDPLPDLRDPEVMREAWR